MGQSGVQDDGRRTASFLVPRELRMPRKTFEFGTAALIAPDIEAQTVGILSRVPAAADPEVAALDGYWAREQALYRQQRQRGAYETFLPGRAYTYKRLGQILESVFPGGGQHMVDVGCGSSILSRYVTGRVAHYVALDISRSALGFASELAHDGQVPLQLVQASAFRIPLTDASIDVSVSLGLMEHFDYTGQTAILSEMSRVSRRGSVVVVPNTRSAIFRAMSALEASQSGPAYSFPLEEHYYDVDFAALAAGNSLSVALEGAFHMAPPAEIPGEYLDDREREMFVALRETALATYQGDALAAWWRAEDSVDVETRNTYAWFRFAAFA